MGKVRVRILQALAGASGWLSEVRFQKVATGFRSL